MVTVMKAGAEVKISKRSGGYVTLRDLIDWTSRDAVRFFLISRKADTEFVFDVDLALKANDENPVFYVQYAHARICSVLAQYTLRTGRVVDAAADLALLTAPTEATLMLKLAAYPDMLSAAATDLAPHDVAFYLRDLASAFHSWYGAERFLIDDAALAASRMALLAATRQVLHNALAMMGVSAPQAMAREPLPTADQAGHPPRGFESPGGAGSTQERPQADQAGRPPRGFESPGQAGSTQERPQAGQAGRPPRGFESPGQAGSTQENIE